MAAFNQGKSRVHRGNRHHQRSGDKKAPGDIANGIPPVDINSGTLRLWFLVGDATMIFEPGLSLCGENHAGRLSQRQQ